MGKRRVTLFITFNGEPDDDSKLAMHVAEALCNRLKGVGKMECKSFTPGPAAVDCIGIAVGSTLLARVDENYNPMSTSSIKHG